MTENLSRIALAILFGLIAGVTLAISIVGAALTFVIGRWCAKVLGWY